ncbi:MAG TPA: Ig-like domain-containing protein [Vicinamibacterales bacterium]
MRRRALLAFVAFCAAAVSSPAQAPGRMATSTDSLVAFPVFYHGKTVAVRGAIQPVGEIAQVVGTSKPIYIYWRDRPSKSEGEIRGEFWDLGRMEDGDPRFTGYDFAPVTAAANNGRWPGRDKVFVILGATLVDSPPPTDPSLRSIALAPRTFEGRGVTLTGRFRGRNLYGDLPQALNKGKWDFVLQSADAAIWVTGARPKGKGFELDPGARADTGKWVEVKGTIRRDNDLVWLDAQSVDLSTAPAETPIELSIPTTPTQPPPTVIFSAPIVDDTDVPLTAPVRIQFSWDMEARSFAGRIAARYTGRTPPGQAPPEPPAFTARYDEGTRSLELRFAKPLERFQTVTIELLEGIKALGGAPLAPWTMSFSTGG